MTGPSRAPAVKRWNQGFGVLSAGTPEERVPFLHKETAERVAAAARDLKHLIEVFPDTTTGGWSYRRLPEQRRPS